MKVPKGSEFSKILESCEHIDPRHRHRPAVLHAARVDQLPLAPLAVHGLEVLHQSQLTIWSRDRCPPMRTHLERGAGVVLVQLPRLQLALVPLHVRAPVPHRPIHLTRQLMRFNIFKHGIDMHTIAQQGC